MIQNSIAPAWNSVLGTVTDNNNNNNMIIIIIIIIIIIFLGSLGNGVPRVKKIIIII